jgi:hypothetical protein
MSNNDNYANDFVAATINKLPSKLQKFAWKHWEHLKNQGHGPQPEDFGLEASDVSDIWIKLAQMR